MEKFGKKSQCSCALESSKAMPPTRDVMLHISCKRPCFEVVLRDAGNCLPSNFSLLITEGVGFPNFTKGCFGNTTARRRTTLTYRQAPTESGQAGLTYSTLGQRSSFSRISRNHCNELDTCSLKLRHYQEFDIRTYCPYLHVEFSPAGVD
jgi:hypothetical protein